MSLLMLLVQQSQSGGPGTAEGHGAPEALSTGDRILEHVLNSQELELPVIGTVHLPTLHLFGWELPVTRHAVMLWIVSLILLILGIGAARRHKSSPGKLGHLIEMAVLFVRDDIALPNIGKEGARYVPYLISTFLFILFANLLGLIPYLFTSTGNISVTAGLAIIAFVTIQFAGIRKYGLIKHLRHLMPHGLPLWLAPIMIPVEIFGNLIKPMALCIRLFANMTGGHVVILSLISLIFILGSPWVALPSVPMALFIDLLELLVAFIQAYIFTMLTSLFIGMSVHPH